MTTRTDSLVPIHAVSYETFDWRPRAPEMHSRAEVERQTGPYDAAITPPVATWSPVISSEDSANVEDATRQLVEFDHHAQKKLGTDNPALGPMTAMLLRTESASSSQIEQLTTSAKQLALAEIDEGDKQNALTVVGNVRAMEAALALADDISENSILAMHKALMLHHTGFPPEDAGRYRQEQVWIGPGEAGPRLADFVAPHHDRIPGAIDDLVSFVRRQDIPVLVQVAVAHAQFETIHPFPDGNGRAGRAFAQSILRNKGLVGSTAVPISAGLLVDVRRYFDALSEYRKGDTGPIIRDFANASRIAATTGTLLVDELVEQLEESRKKMAGIRADAAAWKILPTLVGQPAVNVKYLKRAIGLGEMAALRALDALTERKVLTETTGKSRGRVWQHGGIFDVLDSYASMIRRMSAR
ncbi:Fic family protein [Microbacterium sp. CFH 90308]|uniref:Fic family protein n=1 Tax=Microbacterium salsuginis TaxID=2722803 RepID=A0ABX1KII6_9MICO|nr:Fic family protein [Microbacterium sp. CFH 90308]NLP85176.1 Fic family protein [Microbacterium sp. CFH 90308]